MFKNLHKIIVKKPVLYNYGQVLLARKPVSARFDWIVFSNSANISQPSVIVVQPLLLTPFQ
jgi:hypothetical protein